MHETFKLILSLQDRFPKKVEVYPQAQEMQISLCEHTMKLQLPDDLKNMWLLTNGFSIADYCLYGAGNKKIANLLGNNFPLEKRKYGYGLEFMGTSGGDNFYLVYNSKMEFLGVFYSGDYGDTLGIRFNTVFEFLNDFVMRVGKSLEEHGEDIIGQPIDYS